MMNGIFKQLVIQHWFCHLSNRELKINFFRIGIADYQRQVGLYFIRKNIANFTFQPYLNILNVGSVRKSTSQLRLSSHRVCIETGRGNQPTSTLINKRKCMFCLYLDDEYHCIIECNPYIKLRKQLIPIYYWKYPNMLKCTELINCTNARILCNFGSYVNKALKSRKELLYR